MLDTDHHQMFHILGTDPPSCLLGVYGSGFQSYTNVLQGTRTIEYCRPRQFAGYLNGEGFVIVFDFLRTHIAAWGEHVAVFRDPAEGDARAETWNVFVGLLPRLAPQTQAQP